MPWRLFLLGVIAAVAAGSARADGVSGASTGFGAGGVVVVGAGDNVVVLDAVAVARDGSLIVAANRDVGSALVFRLTADGRRVDFGSRHRPVRITGGGQCVDAGVAIKRDGSIVVACGETLATLAPSGRLRSVVSIAGADLNDVIVDSLGRTVAAGDELVRLLPDGQLDPAFGTDGHVPLPSSAVAFAVGGGRILVVANGSVYGYRDDGSPDMSFGSSGVASAPDFTAESVTTYKHWFFAGGTLASDAAVVRFFADGSLDTTYGTAGVVSWSPDPTMSGEVDYLAPRADGALDAALTLTGPDDPYRQEPPLAWLVQRLLPTGKLGPSDPGPATPFPTGDDCADEFPTALVEQPDGKTIVAGEDCYDTGPVAYALVVRYTPNVRHDQGTPLRLRALGAPVVHGRTVTVRIGVNGPARIVANVPGERATTVDIAHGPVTIRVWAGTRPARAVNVAGLDAPGFTTHIRIPIRS